MATEAFATSLPDAATRCCLCRDPIPPGTRCLCTEAVRSDGAKVTSFICKENCARAIGVAWQLSDQ